MTTSNTYYVSAVAAGNFAKCEYFVKNEDGSYTQVYSPLTVQASATACVFVQHPASQLNLQATVFKTLPISTAFSDYNYAAASGEQVAVTMPDTKTVSKGVVLMFTNADGTQILSSSDPIVKNNE